MIHISWVIVYLAVIHHYCNILGVLGVNIQV